MDRIRIVDQCKSGDRKAFGLLYETYLPAMREVVAYYIHNSDAIWDVIHDGFIIAFASLDTLRDGSKVEAWLMTIMKNLSLQYLREEARHISVPMSDTLSDDSVGTDVDEERELTWEELDKIIDKLPKGYNKVFRLAILDGLSHKEIATQLGIAPHSSSSQLTHAKAMLRRLIAQYRMEMGILSIIGLIWLIWYGFYRNSGGTPSVPIISENTETKIRVSNDSIMGIDSIVDNIMPNQELIHNIILHPEGQQSIAHETISNDSIPAIKKDSISNDTTKIIPNAINIGELIAQKCVPLIQPNETHDWSLSLTYTGRLEHNDLNRYPMPNPDSPDPDSPDGEDPSDEIEVTEKTRHYMPLVIGLSVNKSLTSRWSVEIGLRYTYLRSDNLKESELIKKETIQRMHYIGIPMKFNCGIVSHNGFSLYGQGGGALDIPVYGTQYIWEHSPKLETTNKDMLHIHAPLQWSVEGGLGIQYHLTPYLSIYAEPSLRYYINNGSGIKTIRCEKPFEFTIPIGLRLMW